MAALAVGLLPEDPLAAAALFHGEIVPQVRAAIEAGDAALVIAFPPASPAHRDWRRAAIATLARELAPARINAVEGEDRAALAAATAWLLDAAGVTGQLFPLDSQGAGKLLR